MKCLNNSVVQLLNALYEHRLRRDGFRARGIRPRGKLLAPLLVLQTQFPRSAVRHIKGLEST